MALRARISFRGTDPADRRRGSFAAHSPEWRVFLACSELDVRIWLARGGDVYELEPEEGHFAIAAMSFFAVLGIAPGVPFEVRCDGPDARLAFDRLRAKVLEADGTFEELTS